MPNTEPLLSVITVVFNGVSTIEQTIRSVTSQNFRNFEYIIIDGGSTDGTLDIIYKYQETITVWKSEPDKGIYDAMNKGIKLAKGTFVGILNSDDWYEKGVLQKISDNHLKFRDVDVFHGLLKVVDMVTKEPLMIIGNYSSNMDTSMIEHPTCFVKRDLFDQVGYFNLIYKSGADYDWMLRAKKHDLNFHLIPEVLTSFRTGGMSSGNTGMVEGVLIKRRHGIYSKNKYLFIRVSMYLKKLKNKFNL